MPDPLQVEEQRERSLSRLYYYRQLLRIDDHWTMLDLGSAAAGAAGAQGGARGNDSRSGGSGKRASSEGPRRHEAKTRSRSPGAEAAEVRSEKYERSILAPMYVEPGGDADTLGIEGRHRNNMEKIFGYLHHLEKVVNSHADDVDDLDFERRVARRAARASRQRSWP